MSTKHSENARQMIADGRNIIRQKALSEGFDYWLSLEQDIIPPTNVVERLLSNKKSIVSASYFNFSHEENTGLPKPNAFCLIKPNDELTIITRRMHFDDMWPSRLIKVFLTGFGCLLLHKSVLQKTKFRIDENLTAYDDVFFCRDAQKEGFEVYLDSRVMCLHYNQRHSKELEQKLWSK